MKGFLITSQAITSLLCAMVTKVYMNSFKWLANLVVFMVPLALFQGCGICENQIISQAISPDNLLKMLVIKRGCGATTSDVINIYIVENSEEPTDLERQTPLFVADRVRGLKVIWKNKNIAVIEYKAARIFSFQNFWGKKIDSKYREISIFELNSNYYRL